MYRTLRFSIANLEIRATLVWLLVVSALAVIATYLMVPGIMPSLPGQVVFVMATLVGVIGSLTAHELAHLLVARRSGAGLVAISPQLAGALPDTVFEARDPASELKVGIAGPLASLFVGAIAGGVWLVSLEFDSSNVSTIVGLLALANLGLVVVSLMPGYPFDGGRIARGVFWYLGGDLMTATKIVGYVGYVVIMAVMALGALLVVSGGTYAVWGVWVLLTAFMINRSVADGISHVFWSQNSQRLRVDDLFVGGTRRIQSNVTIDAGIERMLEGHDDGPLMVFDGDSAVGLVDLKSIRPVPRRLWTERQIADVMAPIEGLPSTTSSSQLSELIDLLPPDQDAIALITRDGRIIGATDRADVVRRLQNYLAAERLDKLRRGGR